MINLLTLSILLLFIADPIHRPCFCPSFTPSLSPLSTVNGKKPVWTMIEPKSSMPPARAGHCAASYDGKVYM